MAPRVWVRMELFEHFALPFAPRCLAQLTSASICAVVGALHALELPPAPALGSVARPIPSPRYEAWQQIATEVLQWKELECRSFWLVLTTAHRHIRVPSEDGEAYDASALADEDYYTKESIPLFKLVIYLYLHLEKPSKAKPKTAFSAVWHHDEGTPPPSPRTTPNSPGPASPHTIGLKDRSEAETQYLHFVRDHLDTLIVLLFDVQRDGNVFADILLRPEQLDVLGFLLAGGDSFVQQRYYLSTIYPKWVNGSQYTSKLAKWLKKYLTLNDVLYPPIGFALPPSMHFQLHGSFDLMNGSDMDDSEGAIHLQRPLVLSNVAKSTVIKRADEMTPRSDVTIFACHDAFVYILGPRATHVSIVACANCKIVLVPNHGVLSIDRCESVKVTGVAALLRVHNCLDSTFNVFTPRRGLFSGDNRGLLVGPYNCSYPMLAHHLSASEFAFVPHTAGMWDKFLNLASPEDAHEKDAIVLQSPSQFIDVCIPVKMELSTLASTSKAPPLALPPPFEAVVQQLHANVESLRVLLAQDDLESAGKRALEQAVQAKFKEWLTSSGHAREVLDLVQLEKARAHSM
ncbi:hypothetical protein SDRG_04340 [Saprolegnia diclina VS20]|uniref:C-CAP/cofactor C-like domain-containing protein n=1 Tax=Saprolegnia diclina (strain VS20) TaxID=1156394 RepID=T0QVE1_SAPDV|nr:hypothetical protein SDRG_04340 [Saprolegnia diclina VS20]EQC38641.1 hypothetical protein SDRG_04340 [Saprolegnia diclina VS20]|eukprot:XP_008608233.1 hypothetical protein SDRG_04340 [Saprolegnia diclina VS20]